MIIEKTKFQDLYIIHHKRVDDKRGLFIKPLVMQDIGKVFNDVNEAYFSQSARGVFRGLHYQHGEKAQKKYVVCLWGSIEDIAVDMRQNSETYGEIFRIRLDAFSGIGVLIPEGFAHGIYAHEESIIVNFCDKPYSSGDEGGINPTSLQGISDLEIKILSEKDRTLPSFQEVIK